MSYTNNSIKSGLPLVTPFGGSADVDNVRRTFGIGDKVAQLAPETSIFFSYLSKLGKKATDETIWKPLEYRNQWQRRNFFVSNVAAGTDGDGGTTLPYEVEHWKIWVDYNYQGKVDTTKEYSPIFIVPGQVLRVNGMVYKIAESAAITYYTGSNVVGTKDDAGKTATGYIVIAESDIALLTESGTAVAAVGSGVQGQVIGSQWSEASGAPEGFRDELSATEFYTQIFKTAVPLMSGSTMATKYRGFANEWSRIYTEHLKAHKMDLENAFLFGYGGYTSADVRNSWGLIPFLEAKGGKRYQFEYHKTNDNLSGASATYDVQSKFNYDGVIDVMDDFMAYETGNSGQKLCLTSRKVINALHKVGANSFLNNSFDSNTSQLFNASLDTKKSSFMPVDITSISTSYGSMNFVAHPLFRGDMVDKAVCVDLSNVSMRHLAGNGVSRDTHVETNVQGNDIDGRKDQIITEAGLEVLLPETHATIDFVTSAS
tara:strand:+ start:6397 stop:7851 length:1455 start_codon:yes stop_codon:yes gene_type:complete